MKGQGKEKLLDFIERTLKFKKKFKKEGTLYLACNDKRRRFSLLQTVDGINFGLVRMYGTLYRISWIIHVDRCESKMGASVSEV